MKTVWKRIWTACSTDRPQAYRRAAERGMTLVEIMVVVVIISLVTGIVGVTVFNQLQRAQVETARTQIRSLSDALELYKLALRQYPSTGEGLNALVAPKNNEKPFLQAVPKDPWGNDYVYINPGTRNANGFDLMSYGADGVQSEDDVGNWAKDG